MFHLYGESERIWTMSLIPSRTSDHFTCTDISALPNRGGEVIRGLRGLGYTRFRTTLINDSRFEIHSNKSSPMYGGR